MPPRGGGRRREATPSEYEYEYEYSYYSPTPEPRGRRRGGRGREPRRGRSRSRGGGGRRDGRRGGRRGDYGRDDDRGRGGHRGGGRGRDGDDGPRGRPFEARRGPPPMRRGTPPRSPSRDGDPANDWIHDRLVDREKARVDRDWGEADKIRDELRNAGVEIYDRERKWEAKDGRVGLRPNHDDRKRL